MTRRLPNEITLAQAAALAQASEIPVVLDAFAGEGAAGHGYHLAGYYVIGVENNRARAARYPFPIIVGDAIEAILEVGPHADLVHGSPTCTGYSRGTAAIPDRVARYDRLIPATREAMLTAGAPYVIENVEDARTELVEPTTLCWSMFHRPGSVTDTDGTPLQMYRHRVFETSFDLKPPRQCRHAPDVQVAGAYGGARRNAWEARHVRKGGYVPRDLEVLRKLIGAPWMTERGCFLAIPPTYTRHIGTQLIEEIAS